MPNVDTEPSIYQHFSGDNSVLKDIKFPSLRDYDLKNENLKKLNRSLVYIVEQAKRENPYDRELIDQVATLVFGPLYAQNKLGEVNTEKGRELAARIQQQIGHNIVYASLNLASDDITESTYQVAAALETIVNENPQGEDLRGIWNGIIAQVALEKLLMRERYKVRVPNSTRRSLEVLHMDVRDKIDFVATPLNPIDTRLLCIDAKSDYNLNRFGGYSISRPLRDISVGTPTFNYLQTSTQQTLRRSNRDAIRAAVYIAPTPPFVSRLDRNNPDHRTALRYFATIDPKIGKAIVYELQSAMVE